MFDRFFLRLKLAFVIGVLISSPVWLYQFWAFIAPGLYRRERRWAYFFVGTAVPLFAFGAALAYFAMTRGLHFLLGLVPERRRADHHASDTYLSYAMAMLLIFGLAFELPLVLIMLQPGGRADPRAVPEVAPAHHLRACSRSPPSPPRARTR